MKKNFALSLSDKLSRNIILGIFVLALLVPTIFSGGQEEVGQGIIFACVALLSIFLSGRIQVDDRNESVLRWSLLVFLLSIFASVLFSFDRYQSFRGLILMFVAVVIFEKAAVFFTSKQAIEKLFSFLLFGTLLFAIFGLYVFMGASPFFRLGSVFYQQNAFAGFLLPSFFFVFGSIFYTSNKAKKIVFSVIGIFLVLVLFLTFARGAAMALAGGLLFAGLLLKWPLRNWRRHGFGFLLIVLIGISLASLAFQVKNAVPGGDVTQLPSGPSQIFAEETTEENGLTARFHYLYDAGRIFSYHPLAGVGWGSFGDAFTEYRQDLRFYTTDPHNVIARAFVELGVFGGASLIIIFFCLLVFVFRLAKQARQFPEKEFTAFLLIGSFLALLFQNFVNADWIFPADLILFWIVAGMLVGFYRGGSDLSATEKTSLSEKLVAVLTFIIALFGLITVLAYNYFSDASIFLSQGRVKESLSSYQSAVRFDSWNPLYRRDLAVLYLRLAASVRAGESRTFFESRAKSEVAQAFASRPADPYLFFLRGRAKLLGGDTLGAEADFRQAISHDRFMLLDAYRELSNIYFARRDYQSIITIFEPVLKAYSPEVFGSIAWIDPFKDQVKKDIADLWVRFGLAEVGRGGGDGTTAFEAALLLSPQNAQAKQGLSCLKKQKTSPESFLICFNSTQK